jgi:hypothetical protein
MEGNGLREAVLHPAAGHTLGAGGHTSPTWHARRIWGQVLNYHLLEDTKEPTNFLCGDKWEKSTLEPTCDS